MKGKGLLRICTVFLVIISMLAMNVPMAFAAVTYAPSITVTNNQTGTPDTVVVKGSITSTVYSGDIVKVYRVASSTAQIPTGASPIGQAVASGSTKVAQATVSISQLGTTAGFIRVRVTPAVGSTNGTVERDVTAAKPYAAEKAAGITPTPVLTTVTAANYYNLDDEIKITGASNYPVGSIVKVYRSATSKVVLGRGEIGTGGNATIVVPQLGTRAGTVYISVTKSVYSESKRLARTYLSEVSEAIPAGAITVVNNHDNSGTTDTVTITASKATLTKALAVGDVIKVYRGATGGTLLADPITLDDTGNQTINLNVDLGVKASKLYITRTSSGKKESARTAVSYKAENTSKALTVTQVTYANNRYGTPDTITVSNTTTSRVYEGCTIRVYEEIGGGSVMGTGIVANGQTSVTFTPTAATFLDANGGTFYVSIERVGENESNRTAIKYKAEAQLSTTEMETNYTLSHNQNAFVTNNPEGTPDTVTVSGLTANDVLRLYSTSNIVTDKEPIGEEKAAGASATISVNQLPQPASVTAAVYLTVTPVNSVESARYELVYTTDNAYIGITTSSSNVSNADGIALDSVTVSGLTAYDTVKVYDASTSGNLLGAEIVDAAATQAIVNLILPTTTSGSVYVAITKFGAEENKNRITVNYLAE